MPKMSEAHAEARRMQIMTAAVTCFARNGFHQTTIKDICKEADLSPGAVYLYFKDKRALIKSMADLGAQQTGGIFDESAKAADAAEELRAVMDVFFVQIAKGPQAQTTMRMEVNRWAEALRDPEMHALANRNLKNVLRRLTEIVERGQQQGLINPDFPPKGIARVFLALQMGSLVQKLADPGMKMEEQVALINGLFEKGLWK
ncbi:MAG: TetR/AcrR family transcriptional regulator [bacterium]